MNIERSFALNHTIQVCLLRNLPKVGVKSIRSCGRRMLMFFIYLKQRRVANLDLDFDLNDGVILHIALLWELIPWSEPTKYWEELQEGTCDWSHAVYQL
jgi:hypothetical protein